MSFSSFMCTARAITSLTDQQIHQHHWPGSGDSPVATPNRLASLVKYPCCVKPVR